MKNVFDEYLDDFMVCYIDDIFIFTKFNYTRLNLTKVVYLG